MEGRLRKDASGSMCIETGCAEETYALGLEYGKKAASGDVVTLDGDLGAGKTVFAKGFAEGLGITENVNSPTFTILQVYEGGRLPLYHFDVYRIDDPEEMWEVGMQEYLGGDGVCLIEWSERIGELIPADCIRIRIMRDPAQGDDYRKIEVFGA